MVIKILSSEIYPEQTFLGLSPLNFLSRSGGISFTFSAGEQQVFYRRAKHFEFNFFIRKIFL